MLIHIFLSLNGFLKKHECEVISKPVSLPLPAHPFRRRLGGPLVLSAHGSSGAALPALPSPRCWDGSSAALRAALSALLFPSPLTSCRLWKGEVNSGGSICCIGPEACVSSFKSKYWKLVGFLNNCLIQLRPYYYYKIKGISRWFLSDLLILLNLWFNQFQCIGQTKDYSSMWVLCSKSCTVSWKNSAVGQGQGWVPSHRPLCSSELNHSPTLGPRSLFCE